MASILNALFGHHKDKDDKKHSEKVESPTAATTTTGTATGSSSSGSSVAHTAVSEDVRVHSTVSTQSNTNVTLHNSKKIADLMSKLGTTHHQIDEYSKKRTEEISDAVSGAIEKVVADTAAHQQQLLSDANLRTTDIENEYKQRLQQRVMELDSEKAVLLAELERNLNARQEAILLKARENIDLLQNAANQQKMAVFKEAQVKANQQVDQITEQVAGLAAEDAQRRLQSTTQTIIKTQSIASGETHVPTAHVAASSTTTTTKSSESHQTYQSSNNH